MIQDISVTLDSGILTFQAILDKEYSPSIKWMFDNFLIVDNSPILENQKNNIIYTSKCLLPISRLKGSVDIYNRDGLISKMFFNIENDIVSESIYLSNKEYRLKLFSREGDHFVLLKNSLNGETVEKISLVKKNNFLYGVLSALDDSYIQIFKKPAIFISSIEMINELKLAKVEEIFFRRDKLIINGYNKDYSHIYIDWGDGSNEKLEVSEGPFSFSLKHKYIQLKEAVINVSLINDNNHKTSIIKRFSRNLSIS